MWSATSERDEICLGDKCPPGRGNWTELGHRDAVAVRRQGSKSSDTGPLVASALTSNFLRSRRVQRGVYLQSTSCNPACLR